MRKTLLNYLLVLTFVFQLFSCKTDSQQLMPVITGKAGELIIVVSEKNWKSEVGDSLEIIFEGQQIGLPQYGTYGGEPIFDVVNMPKSAFRDIVRSHRNIIITSISSEHTRPEIKIKTNYWAKGQMLIYMDAPDQKSFIGLLDRNKEMLVERIVDAERNRQVTINKKLENQAVTRQLINNHHLVLNAPKGYNIDVDREKFVWISYKPKDMILGVFVYYQDYLGPEMFNKNDLLSIRDSVLKIHVPGEKENSYMTTERDYPIFSREYNIDGRYTYEMKGLWTVEGDFMGGPFISYTTVDENRNRLVTVEGFVFRPNQNKRNAIRKVESILRTLAFVD